MAARRKEVGGRSGDLQSEAGIAIPIAERWVLEVYRTIIGTLLNVAWMLLVFSVVALMACVIVRRMEGRRGRSEDHSGR